VIVETVLKELELPPQGPWRAAARFIGWSLVALYFAFAAAVMALRYWILPNVGVHSGEIEQSVSKALGLRVTIGTIEAGWQGLRPELFLGKVTVYDRDGRAALSLPSVEAIFAWKSVLVASPRFYSLAIERPKLEIRRDPSGRFYVAGIALQGQEGAEAGIAQWVFSQREIAIRDASITWIDEQRGAPALPLSEVNLQLRDGGSHRFALRAKAPPELASMLDIRGELRGGDLDPFRKWTGRLYAQLEYTDLTAWRPWINYPFVLQSGKGGVRVWLDVGENGVAEATADVALSQVATRVAKNLPLLQLDYLHGRLGARQTAENKFEVFGRKLTLRTGGGIALAPADFLVRWRRAEGEAAQEVEIEADQFELAPLASLAEYLPFPTAARARLAATAPRGSVRNLKLAWTGEPDNPQRYSMRGGFANLAMRANQGRPGFAGLTGRVEASEKGGMVTLGSSQSSIELPGVMPESPVRLDSLTAQIGWKIAPGRFDLDFSNLSIANRDVAGTLFGSYSSREGGAGVIDLTGQFSRADGKAAYRYIPLLPAGVVEYLKASIRAGQSNDVRLRLKGDLARFPFDNPSVGTFQIVAKVENAEFRFAEGWPQASGLSGDLVFDGKSMRVAATKAGILGVKSRNVRATIPDLFHGNEHVQLDLQAEGPTSDFLGFISQSPVTGYLDRFTEGIQASGAGRLALQLDLPLRRRDLAKLAGDYQFLGNQLRLDAETPPFSQVNGRIEFTGTGVTARALTAQLLGGPATVSVTTRSDGTIVASAHGTANAGQFPRSWESPLLRRVSGAAAWQATVTGVRGRAVTLALQSQLIGISADLPQPLGKTAGQPMPLALTIERPIGPAARRGDTIKASLSNSVKVEIERRRDGDRYVVERGVVSLNEPAELPDRAGMLVSGTLDYVDADRWRELFGGEDGGGLASSSLDLKVAALDFGGRRINDVALRAGSSGSVWVANVSAKELSGEIAWRPEGQGRIVARLKHFSLPEPTPNKKQEPPSRELPALDIIADRLIVGDNNLGRLELSAVNEALDWRIEKMVLTGPESLLKTTNGIWRAWALRPGFSVSFELEVRDIGKYLERMGYPRTVQRGEATLKGTVNWAGSPQSIDFPSLRGDLELKAGKGQFLKAEPGVARLLGILSMQSWVTLDFRDLFGQGYAFDSIRGKASVADGVMSMREFEMRGPSARVTMDGRIDLVKETQDLHARVEPSVDSIPSILAVLANPVWGVATFLLQKILKNPLGQAFAFEYKVTGTWTEPQVDRLKADVRTAEGPPQSPQ
jgi:uncharacterized protein (TIGR02099 family)